jgi:hypothetical protein
MEDVEAAISDSTKKTEGFFKYVFKMGDYEQSVLMNIAQYTVLAIIPVIIVLYVNHYYIPDVDEEKGSLTILAEMFGQLFFILFSFYFIHRIICYFPTYSGLKYGDFSVIQLILILLFIFISMSKHKLGAKTLILIDRFEDVVDGNSSMKDKNKKDGNGGGQVRVTQPLSGQTIGAPSSSFMLNGPPPPPQLQQRSPDFNAMYAQQNNPLIGASMPGMPPGMVAEFEPAAANEHLGGSFF